MGTKRDSATTPAKVKFAQILSFREGRCTPTTGQVYELEEGRIVRVRNYLSHAAALEAVGLSK
jgi:hypothetical protein